MRRLTLLPCPENWERMPATDEAGRWCAKCTRRVVDARALDEAELEALADRAAARRVCGHFELSGSRVHTKTGLAAGVLLTVLSGCATTQSPTPFLKAPSFDFETPVRTQVAGEITGTFVNHEGAPMAGVEIMLWTGEGPRVVETLENGRYSFEGLPPGHYRIQSFGGLAAGIITVELPPGAGVRLDAQVSMVIDVGYISSSRSITTGAIIVSQEIEPHPAHIAGLPWYMQE